MVCDRRGIPLTGLITAANAHDSEVMVPLLDPIRPDPQPERKTPAPTGKLHADKAYDQGPLRAEIRRRGITARNGVEASDRLGRHRWIAEACLSRLLRNRRLVRRYDRKAAFFASLSLVAAVEMQVPVPAMASAAGPRPAPARGSAVAAADARTPRRRVGNGAGQRCPGGRTPRRSDR